MYLLDTNICIYAMKGSYPALTEKLFQVHPDQIAISSVTVSKLEYGAAKSKWDSRTCRERNADRPLRHHDRRTGAVRRPHGSHSQHR